MYLNLVKNTTEKASLTRGFVINGFGLTALIVNAILRTLVFLEKRRTDKTLGEVKNTLSEATKHLLLQTLMVLAGPFALLMTLSVSGEKSNMFAASRVIFVHFCLVVPVMVAFEDEKLRSFVKAKAERTLKQVRRLRNRSIHVQV